MCPTSAIMPLIKMNLLFKILPMAHPARQPAFLLSILHSLTEWRIEFKLFFFLKKKKERQQWINHSAKQSFTTQSTKSDNSRSIYPPEDFSIPTHKSIHSFKYHLRRKTIATLCNLRYMKRSSGKRQLSGVISLGFRARFLPASPIRSKKQIWGEQLRCRVPRRHLGH